MRLHLKQGKINTLPMLLIPFILLIVYITLGRLQILSQKKIIPSLLKDENTFAD